MVPELSTRKERTSPVRIVIKKQAFAINVRELIGIMRKIRLVNVPIERGIIKLYW
jgi:hypothetical protein